MLDIRTVAEDGGGAEPLTFAFARELDEADIAMRGSGREVGSSPPPALKRLRAKHHALARALANGMRPGIAAATYGYHPSRVSILQNDPAFRELIEHYRGEGDHDYARVQERLAGLSVEALDEIERRLEEEPESFKPKDLLSLVEITADRTGHGPKSSQDVNVNVGFADRLREARKRAAAISGPIIDAEVLPPEAAE